MNKRMILVLLLLCGLGIFLTVGCGNDDDDDNDSGETGDDDDDDDNNDDDNDNDNNDDDDEFPLEIEGVFVLPNFHYADTDEQIAGMLDEIQAQGVTTVIWQWTLLYNRVCYPSESFDEIIGMSSDDLLGGLFSGANARGMKVILGLSAGRRPNDKFFDEVGPEAQRVETLIDELTTRYGAHESFVGFYLPYQFLHAPMGDEITLLSRIAAYAHQKLPGADVLLSASYPGPNQWSYPKFILQNSMYPGMSQDDIDDADQRAEWAKNTVAAFSEAGIDVMLLKTMMGNYKNDYMEAILHYTAVLSEADAQNASVEIRSQIDLYDGMNRQGAMHPAKSRATLEQIREQKAVAMGWLLPAYGFSWDNYVNEDGALTPPHAGTDPVLLEKALKIEEHLRSRCMRFGNVVTVVDGQEPLDTLGNRWQEDSCWITSLYCGAASFRCAATGEAEACEYARQLFNSLHDMANQTPLPGEVVRDFAPYYYGQLNPVAPGSSTIKRWHKHPDKEQYWVGDISVDQLSGYFYGLPIYYELVATDEEKAVIEADIANIMGNIADNHLMAYEFNGQNATYGKLRAAPELATTFLAMSYRITGEERYLELFNKLLYAEHEDWLLIVFHWATHQLKQYGGQHFHDSGLRILYEYMPEDPVAYRRLIWGLEYAYQGSFTWGNAMANFTYQAQNPDSAGGARSLHDHYMYDPSHLDNGNWASDVNESFAGGYYPMEYRAYDEWDWTIAPDSIKNPRGGPNHRYPGASYLVTYWEGRWHGWIP